jgi:hypothetical protein
LRILDAVCGPEPETPVDAIGRMRCDQPLLIIEPGSNHREDQLRRAHSASSRNRLPSGGLCSIRGSRAAVHSNPNPWDTRSWPASSSAGTRI